MVFKRRDKPPLLIRLREAVYPRRGWRRAIEYLGHRVKRIPDTPHRIALGFACGVMVSFTPLFGLHLVLAVLLPWALRCNIVASLIGSLVGNPVTLPFIAWISLALGRRILGHDATGSDAARVSEAFLEAVGGLWPTFLSLFGRGESEWPKLVGLFGDILWPYLVGGLLPGLVAAIISYCLVRPVIFAYQDRRRAHMLKRARDRVHAAKTAADAAAAPPYSDD